MSHPASPTLTGRVVRSDDEDYESARRHRNRLFEAWPLAVVFAQSHEDVQHALEYARAKGLALRARCGRHHLQGWNAVTGGLVLDVSALRAWELDARTGRLRVGAGFTQGELVTRLEGSGWALPCGEEANVGLSGLLLGGGIGPLGRRFGLGCDSVVQVTLVVPCSDGPRCLTCRDDNEQAELLWASRGGGGNQFGVATEFVLQLHRLPRHLLAFQLLFDSEQLVDVLDAWQRWAPFTDECITSVCEVVGRDVVVRGLVVPDDRALESALATHTRTQSVELGPDRPAFRRARTCSLSGPVVDQHRATSVPSLVLQTFAHLAPRAQCVQESWADYYREANAAPRGGFQRFTGGFRREALPRNALQQVARLMQLAPEAKREPDGSCAAPICCSFWMLALAGAVAREARPSCFAHRDKSFYFEPGVEWHEAQDSSRCQGWLGEFAQAMRDYVQGVYVNVPDAAMRDWAEQSHGTNLERLRAVRQWCDPEGLLRFEHSL